MIDRSELKEWLGDPARGDSENALLARIEAQALSLLEAELDQVLSPSRAVTRYVNGSGTDVLWLPDRVADSSTLVLSYRLESLGSWTTLPSANYFLDGRRVTMLGPAAVDRSLFDLQVTFFRGRWNWRAAYTAGYTDGAEPSYLRQAALDVCRYLYRESRAVAAKDAKAASWRDLPSVALCKGSLGRLPI